MRLPPLPADEWDDRSRRALRALLPRARQNPEGAGPAMSTMVRHPDLVEAFLQFGVYLLFRSTLPARLRELAVLRVAHRAGCAYEWEHHLEIAAESGLDADDIAAIRLGRSADPFDQMVLTAVDELTEHATLTDDSWAALRAHLDERQVMDFVFTVGGYTTMAMAFNTFGVEP
ncbi:MAG TPA: carboxymuconolactone decarboxylase family protein [Nocardia sp.]|uniref:carboxymuconolactone decarboxylase family protein n=1 Tax=Nocardia sp. TaxID=1821 RepID=UPI002B4B735E|nr:carboxymuconolactone decarboxylase family protein [Nocardia sp.]HLS75510.1 carboxymuconolactone decarboxylase family protein [Nocardia sp.]